jgi:hypothetical protein
MSYGGSVQGSVRRVPCCCHEYLLCTGDAAIPQMPASAWGTLEHCTGPARVLLGCGGLPVRVVNMITIFTNTD